MDLNKILLSGIVLAGLIISGCSDSTTSTTTTTGPTTPPANAKNVASAANGATASSNFAGNESFTIDGDTGTTNFWVGGAADDEVKIAFDKSYSVSDITVHTNNTSFSTSGGTTTTGIRVLLSDDDITYSEVAVAFGNNGPISCFSLSAGSGSIACGLDTPRMAQFVKVVMTADFMSTQIYEIEVTGI